MADTLERENGDIGTNHDKLGTSDKEEDVRKCPRNIILKSQIVDIAIHPGSDIIAGAKINGKVTVCSFSTSGRNKKIFSLKHHKKACRSISFSPDGKCLYTSSKDKSVQAVDMMTGQVITCIKDAHKSPIYKITSITDKWIATGDEEGCVKVWDVASKKCVVEFSENTDFISDMVCDDAKKSLICSCGDGTLSVFNIRGKKLRGRSDQMETEFLSLAIMKGGSKVACGGGDGTLSIFSWGKWGDMTDRFPGHQASIDSICKINEDILVTGDADGKIRAVHIQPNYFISAIGKHGELPVERLQLSNSGDVLASCSYDNIIKFWDVKDLHDHEPIPSKEKTKKRKVEAMASDFKDFFADL